MNTKLNIKNLARISGLTLILLLINIAPALASAPSNDNFADATVITSFPFSDTTNTTEATVEPGDPDTCFLRYRSIWYTYTPESDDRLSIYSSTDEGYSVTLSIYKLENGGLTSISCSTSKIVTVNLDVTEGSIYYIELMVHSYSDGGNVTINISQSLQPDNDDFAHARVIPDVPYSESSDTTFASAESGEPRSCGWPVYQQSLWYSFTPTMSGSYTAESNGDGYAHLAVYTGSDLYNLQNLACSASDWYTIARTATWLEAGTTYYFQTYVFIQNGWNFNLNFKLYSTPPPEAYFSYWPGDPFRFENFQFYNDTYDPVGIGVETCTWDFGDGGSASDCYPTHTYTADGDYSVHLTVTTYDRRTASTNQTIQVRTHDVGITRFVVPNSAHVGQTKQINVYIKNLYYQETVLVELYKVTANGDVWVGSLVQSMPVRPANRAQLFTFAYTFTSEDAVAGKVTFKVIATLQTARDAFPFDNEMVSFATKVTQ